MRIHARESMYACVYGRRKYRIKPSRKQSIPHGELHHLWIFPFRDRHRFADIICNWINKSDLYAERIPSSFLHAERKIMPRPVKISRGQHGCTLYGIDVTSASFARK